MTAHCSRGPAGDEFLAKLQALQRLEVPVLYGLKAMAHVGHGFLGPVFLLASSDAFIDSPPPRTSHQDFASINPYSSQVPDSIY